MSLPSFPEIDFSTVDSIERVVENLIDKADKAWTSGQITGDDYDSWFVDLHAWTEKQYLILERKSL